MENITYLMVQHQQLMGQRILLRPVSLQDANDMFEYAADKETTRFLFESHKNLEATKKTIAEFFVKDPMGKYAIVLKENNKMIGTIDLRVDANHKKAELGYILNKQFWGNGYVTEAANLLIELGFQTLGLERIYAMYDIKNQASGRVMERLGMTSEGILRKNRLVKGQFSDDECYAILREEYADLNNKA